MLYVWLGAGLLAIWIAYGYNQLVILQARVRNAWAQIEVQLRMRHDLIPNLVATVKGYAAHEKGVFAQVTEAHSRAINAGAIADKAEAEIALQGALKSLFALAEAYPALRASENFHALQQQLADIEKRLAFSRQFYNDTALSYNTRVLAFPSNILARVFHYRQEPYFQAGVESESPIDVKF